MEITMKKQFAKSIISVVLILFLTALLSPGRILAEEPDWPQTEAAGSDLLLTEALESDESGHMAQWWNSRNSETNNSVTDRPTPTSSKEAWCKWAVKFGTGYNASPTPPVIVDNKLYTVVGSKLLEVDKETGATLRESAAMPGTAGYAMQSPLYAEGKIFVAITDSRICAINIDDLSIAWVTDNRNLVKGQMVSPLSYKKINGTGYIYSGTWRNPGGELLCATTDDSDLVSVSGLYYPLKSLCWTFNPDEADAENLSANASVAKGYYWTGAYVSEHYLAIGSDNGEAVGDEAVDTAFYTLDPVNGTIIDAVYGIHGQVRSTVVYNEGCLYFSTKGAKVYKIPVSEEGILGEPSYIDLGEYGATTSSSTPVVYGGKIYLGLSGKGGKLSADGGHGFMVIRDDAVLSGASYLYTISVPGSPQAGALLSTFHETEDFDGDGNPEGRVYLFFTYNAPPGGLFYTWDTPGQTEPTALSVEESKIFVPAASQQQYCISPVIVDTDGVLYYKNDSGNLFAVESNGASLSGLEASTEDGTQLSLDQPFQPKVQEYTVVAPAGSEGIRIQLQLEEDVYAEVAGTAYEEGGTVIPISEEFTDIEIVTQKNGKSRLYTLHVQKASAVADLHSLASSMTNTPPSSGSSSVRTLTPAFDKDITEYLVDWRTNGTGGANDPAGKKLMNLFLKAESDKADVKVWPLENVDTSGNKVLSDGSVKSVTVSGSSEYSLRFPVYSADIKKDSVVRIDVTAQDGATVKSYLVTFNRRILVAGVTLDPESTELAPEETITIKASTTPRNATDPSLTWTSSDEAVAVVDEKGEVTAKREGEAIITAASSDGPSAECRITVTGHVTEKVEKKDPDCEEGGYAEDCYRCIFCEKYFADEEGKEELDPSEIVLEPLGHDLTAHPAVPATYESEGNTAYWECTREGCGRLFADEKATKEISKKDTVIPKKTRTDPVKASSSIRLKSKSATYTGKTISLDAPVVKGSSAKPVVKYYSDKSCTKEVKKHVSAGTYYAKAFLAGDAGYLPAESNVAKLVIKKAANKMAVKTKTLKAKSGKKTTFKAAKAFTVKNAAGKVTYEKISGSSRIRVAKNGTITVNKGLTKGKTYTVKVKVKAAGNKNYRAGTKTVKVKIKVR